MFSPFLLALVLASAFADDPPDVVALIGRLGSDSFAERVAAYRALERLGGAALPALQMVAPPAPTYDTRVRSRVRALIESIERQVEDDRFARPTMIRLDFRTRPLAGVVDDLNDRYDLGLSVRLGPRPGRGLRIPDPNEPDRLKELRAREIRTRAARPLPYWEAIDRLCEAGALHYGIYPRLEFGTVRSALDLMADRTGRGPVSDSGPFRVQITWTHPVIVPFDPFAPGEGPPRDGGLTVPLAVLTEPGKMLRRNGAVSIAEATDDRGRSLVPGAPAGPDIGPANRSRRARGEGDAIQVNAVLVAPDPPSTAIRRLRGKVPVIAVARGANPIVIPLKDEGVVGRPYPTRELVLIVEEVSLAPGAPAWVKLNVRARAAFLKHDPPGPPFAGFNFGGVLEHLELHDADGRRLNHRHGLWQRGGGGGGDHYRLIASPPSEDGPGAGPATAKTPIPTELRFYEFVEKAMEIPFDFRDVPLP